MSLIAVFFRDELFFMSNPKYSFTYISLNTNYY